MMKKQLIWSLSLLLPMLLISCSSDDDLGYNPTEADIYKASLEGVELASEPVIKGDEIIFRLKENQEDYKFSPFFTLSEGASIQPENESEQDFSTPQEYVVTSADGRAIQTYTVRFIVDLSDTYSFSFENTKTDATNNYHVFLDDEDNDIQDWDSGNSGFSLALLLQGKERVPENFPTSQIAEGYQDKGVKLETKKTGQAIAPLAAGNLFIGNFDPSLSLVNPLATTQFGQSYNAKSAPVMLKGYFKYTRGKDFEINSHDVDILEEDQRESQLTEDVWDAYALLFKKSDQENFLTGDHHFGDERIVAIARIDDDQAIETDEWTNFEIPFDFKEDFDLNEEYMYTIVFSSSKEGAIFNGAEGSTLYIDEVELITESDEID